MKFNFSGLTMKQAMALIPAQNLIRWPLVAPIKPPTPLLLEYLERMQAFELLTSEAAKISLIDPILLEILPNYPVLKVWKAEPLEAETVIGVADYLVAPKRAYMETPLLCAIEAKRDDFEKGQIQCVAEMAACRENNMGDGHTGDVHGIVSNGQGWVFYKLTYGGEVWVSGLFTTEDLPKLLGVLDLVCGACAQNVPQ